VFGRGKNKQARRSVLLERYEEERAAASARHEAFLKDLFARTLDTGAAAEPPDRAALDLQNLLAAPQPGALDTILGATFHLRMQGERPRRDTVAGRDVQVYDAATEARRAYSGSQGTLQLKGAELLRLLIEDPQADGIIIDRGHVLGDAKPKLANLLLSPGFAAAALAGRDIRPGAAPLPARSRAEIALWLNLRGFPYRERRLIEAPIPDSDLLIRAHAGAEVSGWRAQEAAGRQEPSDDIWSPVFALSPGAAARADEVLGDGPSAILCAGLLAAELGRAAPGSWPYGRWLLVGRFVDAAGRAFAAHRLKIARELEKLLPAGADCIPRAALLTVEGASWARRNPAYLTRVGLKAEIRHAERHLRPWVWG
jgi:hypothetical protein